MAIFKQNNIQFTADNKTLLTAGQKTTKFGIVTNGDFSKRGDGKTPVTPFVNAVEIDWNGAQLGE